MVVQFLRSGSFEPRARNPIPQDWPSNTTQRRNERFVTWYRKSDGTDGYRTTKSIDEAKEFVARLHPETFMFDGDDDDDDHDADHAPVGGQAHNDDLAHDDDVALGDLVDGDLHN